MSDKMYIQCPIGKTKRQKGEEESAADKTWLMKIRN